ncbi:MAG: RNA polymerase sigma factor [Sedimentisphaerales bacterium]|nr:RNA polymerase sigma factor [Sedimentisphaerales bacterium]
MLGGIDLATGREYNKAVEDQERLDIRASCQGDQEAYRRLVERHQRQVAGLLWRFTRDKGVLEELVQEVFVQAYFSLSGYRGEGSFAGWLSCIATRTGYRFWKKQSRENAHYEINEADAVEQPEDTDEVTPQEAGQVLHTLLAQINETDRLVLTLMYFDGCSTEQIAERMGWNRAMVKMRAYRARNKLRALAEEQGIWETLGWIR